MPAAKFLQYMTWLNHPQILPVTQAGPSSFPSGFQLFFEENIEHFIAQLQYSILHICNLSPRE